MQGAFGQLLSSGRRTERAVGAAGALGGGCDPTPAPASLSLATVAALGAPELAVGMVPGDRTREGKPPCLRLGCIVGSMWRFRGEVVATCVA